MWNWDENPNTQGQRSADDDRAPGADAPHSTAAPSRYGPDAPLGAEGPHGLGPQPELAPSAAAPPARRGPTWGGVVGLVLAGAVLSSGATLGGVVAYDTLLSPSLAGPSASAPSTAAATEQATTSVPVSSTSGGPDWESVASAVSPSTVAIQVSTGSGTAEGTGVIYSVDGTIITNNHVVAGAGQILVSLTDGRILTASVVGTDPSTDIAVIRLDSPPEGLQPAQLGDSDGVVVGQAVMAVGTPLGLENTVTTGIISAVDRPVTTTSESGGDPQQPEADAAYTSALQTDAAINPGNSGGPLVDAQGQVIGINSSIAGLATDESGTAGSIGLGFAIPSNTVRLIADQLIDSGTARHAFLGVSARDGSATTGDVTSTGAEIVGIERGSAAQEAGLREGDLITEADGVPITGAAALTGVVRGLEVGSTHTVRFLRDGEEREVQVTLTAAD
ncbi:trypsin-like peptidase domain-containing protein [Brachybacterium phenoliresistens]|uniref:Peptidase S1 and S6, chymotrypsin/Hap n=2 Tax=Brachybacterium phenoliresistens TaxID=396014 RepID=Z9JW03_9MICO|nr:peptidase S1 and S6, chymotrypsin/Hap [Brachybacterium phenoliresistens]